MTRVSHQKGRIPLDRVIPLPGTLNGHRGESRGSQGGFLAPFHIGKGSGAHAWYCHYYKTDREHYHTNHRELVRCGELYP